MITIDVNISKNLLDSEIKAFESQKVRVGVLDAGEKARLPKSKKAGLKKLKGTPFAARKIKGQSRQMTLRRLAVMLDKRYGFISGVELLESNYYLKKVMNELTKIFDGEVSPKRITNAARALIRNPILEKQYGRNAASTRKNKGFDMPLVDTGAMWNAIVAAYEAN
jgi:hypothetical protein